MDFSNAEIHGRVKAALAHDPALEAKLLDDLGGALAERFGVAVPQPARLSRDGDAYRLTLGSQNYDLGDPRKAAPGELNDAELELVSGGDDNCNQARAPRASPPSNTGRNALVDFANDFKAKHPNGVSLP